MVFNVLANNTDDHNKNFSFIMNEDGSWRLSPAYDITYIIDNGGFLPNEYHCLYIRAKLRGITRDDAIQFARDNGIRRPDAIIRDVVAALKQFRTIAAKYGVGEQWTGRVETTIIDHLKAWGEWQDDAALTTGENASSTEIDHNASTFIQSSQTMRSRCIVIVFIANYYLNLSFSF